MVLVATSAEQMEAALSQLLVPVEVMRAPGEFRGTLECRDFGDGAALVRTRSHPGALARTRRSIAASRGDGLLLEVNLRGRSVVAQRDREALLESGDGVLYDTREPYRVTLPEKNSAYLVHVPRERVPCSERVLRAALARRFDSRLPSYGLLRGYLDVLATLDHPQAAAEVGPMITRTLGDLMASIASSLAGETGVGFRETLLSALQATIHREVSDPALSPSYLARRHHVSLRSVHHAFELTGTTPAAYIRKERLARARQLLEHSHLSVLDVALACGFRSTSTFTRAFRAAYASAPREPRE